MKLYVNKGDRLTIYGNGFHTTYGEDIILPPDCELEVVEKKKVPSLRVRIIIWLRKCGFTFISA